MPYFVQYQCPVSSAKYLLVRQKFLPNVQKEGGGGKGVLKNAKKKTKEGDIPKGQYNGKMKNERNYNKMYGNLE